MSNTYMSNQKPLVPDYILEKLILLYGFNLDIQIKIALPFDIQKNPLFENYFLINSEWLDKYKNFYNYEEISKKLDEINDNLFHYKHYDEFELNLSNIIKELKKNKIFQKQRDFPIDLTNKTNNNTNIIFFAPIQIPLTLEKKPFYYYKNVYIVNKKIIEELCQDRENPYGENYIPFICQDYNFNVYLGENTIFYKNYYIEIGKINQEGVFETLYHISIYNTKISAENEIRNIINQNNLKSYFYFRKIREYLIYQNIENIGYLINVKMYNERLYNNIRNNINKNNVGNDFTMKNLEKAGFHVNNLSKSINEGKNVNSNFKLNPFSTQKGYENIKKNDMKTKQQNNQQYYQNNINNNPNPQPNNNNSQNQKQPIMNGNNQNQQQQNNMNNNQINNTYQNQNQPIMKVNNQNFFNQNQQQQNYINNNQINNFNQNQQINNMNNNQIYNQNQQNNINNNQNMLYQQQMPGVVNQNNQNMMNQFNNLNNNNIQNPYYKNFNQNKNQQIFNNFAMNNNPFFNQPINNNIIINNQINQNNKQNLQQNYKDNNNKPPQKLTSIKEFNYVPMIGLVNLGQTCFMNSVLQCFSNLYHFTNYFLNPSKSKYIEKNTITMVNEKANSLSVAYKELINNLWNGKRNTPFRPDNFKKILGKLNPLFKDNSAGDSKDFAIFFIMQIHNELNNIDVELNKENKPANFVQQDNLNVNPYNQQQVFQYFINDFAMNQNSVITNLFYGINQSMFECQVCKMNNMQRGITPPLYKYNYENFFYLEFPLEEVRKFLLGQNYNMMGMNMGMNYQNINQVDIEDCFKYYQKQNEMFGYCEKCGKDNAKIYSVTNIYSPPKILMIVLNRGKGLQFNIKINFKDNLIVKTLNNDQKYELRSVVKHLGDNSASGHFISYCKSPVQNYNQCWFCFNDTTVVQTNDWKSIIDTGVTYILFYKLLSK